MQQRRSETDRRGGWVRAVPAEGLAELGAAPVPRPNLCRACGVEVPVVRHERAHGPALVLAPSLCTACTEQASAKSAELERARLRFEGLHQAGVPERYRAYDWARAVVRGKDEPWPEFRARVDAVPGTLGVTPLTAPAAKLCRGWTPKDGSVYLEGHVGGGKTLLVCTVLGTLAAQGVSCMFLPERQLWEGTLDGTKPQRRAKDVQVLAWDDFGTTELRGADDWKVAVVEEVVSARYDAGRPILFTSNVPLEAAGAKFGARVKSRLREMVGDRHRVVVDHDWRTGEPYGSGA